MGQDIRRFPFGIGAVFMNWWMLTCHSARRPTLIYMVTLTAGYILLLMSVWISRMLKHNLMEDVFNTANESFMVKQGFMENEYSVNLPTKFVYQARNGTDGSTLQTFFVRPSYWERPVREKLCSGKQLHKQQIEKLCHVYL